jgi:acetylornithine deacetylase/succinyl-diaminopimelate desuccinylase-like protein
MLLYNGHMDTVGVTDRAAWHRDPWMGIIEEGASLMPGYTWQAS